MESLQTVDDDDGLVDPSVRNGGIRLRAYQAEMLEESLRGNVIVVQDTGSGKTHVALARTAVELETCDPNKLIWFLAPTVALCEQQFRVFQANLPAFEVLILSGRDDYDHWSDQGTWDAVLANVRIVLSTHQVLVDALTHGFVKMNRLALLIFDEAHHCTGKHPANKILTNFYRPKIHEGAELPKILGLSASPVKKATVSSQALEEIEKNMNAVARTPKIHRSELLQYVHRPQLLRLDYAPMTIHRSLLYVGLKSELDNYDMSSDPYVVELGTNSDQYNNVILKLQEAYLNNDTYCYKELKLLATRYKDTAVELGFSVADWYLYQSIARYQKSLRSSEQLLHFSRKEKQHLQDIFNRLPLPENFGSQPMLLDDLSPKVQALLDFLTSEASTSLKGLVFVEQKIWVSALAELFSLHPKIRGKLRVETFVGSSASPKRKTNIATLIEPVNLQDTLERFKIGETNLIITTSVLEEGIDVSECHLVVCFETPKNLKSFVQRRGRARRIESKYVIFSAQSGTERSPATWEALEKEMRDAYENDLRHLKKAEESELIEENGDRIYEVVNTGALLTLDNALPHLHHFCAILSSGPYVDNRPEFSFEEQDVHVAATVTLPLSVDPGLRVTRSLHSWRTERMAIKDAAFQSYNILHQNGLVNDNLLPVKQEEDALAAEFQISDKAPSMVNVSAPTGPWLFIAKSQEENPHCYHRTLLEFTGILESSFYLVFHLPVQLPVVPEFTLFWNESRTISVRSHWIPGVTLSSEEISNLRSITKKILRSMHGGRMDETREDFIWLLAPSEGPERACNYSTLLNWDIQTSWIQSASEKIQRGEHDIATWGLVTAPGDTRKWFPRSIDTTPGQEPTVHLTMVPKRRDFLYPLVNSEQKNEAYNRTEIFPADECFVQRLPSAYSVCALLFPPILYRFETYLATNMLRLGLLAPLSFEPEHLPILVQALTSSSTGDGHNYQRLEFFGDCIVKYAASFHVMASHLKWPESFLTGKKGKIVSNGFFARATLSAGLENFIIRKRFTGAKWKPCYANDVLSGPNTEDQSLISSKTLADVIESLVGASYVIGGFPKVISCMQILLPLEDWTPIPESNRILYDAAPAGVEITSLAIVEKLIGYTFSKKLLFLEALTHASYTGPLANCSYERLEFLGDAIFEFIISKRLFAHRPELSHTKMHGMRTAMANGAFLAFSMFETTVQEERVLPPDMRRETHSRCLWQFLRADSRALVVGRDAAIKQHEEAKGRIKSALQNSDVFPWHILALTDSPKFLSDIVESVIGAIYIDSHGDIASCETFVRKLGIIDALERILRDGVDCLHPKERLGILAVEKEVEYVRVVGEGDSGGYRCQVQVGGVAVGGVVEGVKRLNAETLAAWEACLVLEEGGNGDARMDDVVENDEEWFDAEEGGAVELSEEE